MNEENHAYETNKKIPQIQLSEIAVFKLFVSITYKQDKHTCILYSKKILFSILLSICQDDLKITKKIRINFISSFYYKNNCGSKIDKCLFVPKTKTLASKYIDNDLFIMT